MHTSRKNSFTMGKRTVAELEKIAAVAAKKAAEETAKAMFKLVWFFLVSYIVLSPFSR